MYLQIITTSSLIIIEKYILLYSVNLVLSGHSNIDKTKIIKTNGSLMKVKSIAECSFGAYSAILGPALSGNPS